MKCNVGKNDKLFRVVLGVVIIAAGAYFKSWWGAVGIIPLATAVMGFCPFYPFLKVSTCQTDKE